MQSETDSFVRGPHPGTTFEDTSAFSVNISHSVQDGTSPFKFGVRDHCKLTGLKPQGTLMEWDHISETKIISLKVLIKKEQYVKTAAELDLGLNLAVRLWQGTLKNEITDQRPPILTRY